jgi:hypothetical protein
MVCLRKGKGQVVLIGFDSIFSCSKQLIIKILFNALLMSDIQE